VYDSIPLTGEIRSVSVFYFAILLDVSIKSITFHKRT
jgi:hypothetical protein